MYRYSPRYAPAAFALLLTLSFACGRTAAPVSPAPSDPVETSLTAEPDTVRPDFFVTPGCTGHPGFVVRFAIHLRHGGYLFIRTLRFHFDDRFGGRALPEVIALPAPGGISSSLPSSSPVTIPGVTPLASAFPPSGALPFQARFGCGVPADGTLFIDAEHDRGTSSMRVRIAR